MKWNEMKWSRQTLVNHQKLDPAIGTIYGGIVSENVFRGQIFNLGIWPSSPHPKYIQGDAHFHGRFLTWPPILALYDLEDPNLV